MEGVTKPDRLGRAIVSTICYLAFTAALVIVAVPISAYLSGSYSAVASKYDANLLTLVLSGLFPAYAGILFFLVPSLIFGAQFGFAKSVRGMLFACITSGLVLLVISGWLFAPGCLYSHVWEPLCRISIFEAITLETEGARQSLFVHLVACAVIFFRYRKTILHEKLVG